MHQPDTKIISPTFFSGADSGAWIIQSMQTIIGKSLPNAKRLIINNAQPVSAQWSLKRVSSNLRYTTTHEKEKLDVGKLSLGRKEATMATLIPIRKNENWWHCRKT